MNPSEAQKNLCSVNWLKYYPFIPQFFKQGSQFKLYFNQYPITWNLSVCNKTKKEFSFFNIIKRKFAISYKLSSVDEHRN